MGRRAHRACSLVAVALSSLRSVSIAVLNSLRISTWIIPSASPIAPVRARLHQNFARCARGCVDRSRSTSSRKYSLPAAAARGPHAPWVLARVSLRAAHALAWRPDNLLRQDRGYTVEPLRVSWRHLAQWRLAA